MGSDSTTEPFYPDNNCQGEWLNDCPYLECKCAKKILDDRLELKEDYGKQYTATSYGFLYWLTFLALLIIIFLLIEC